MLVGRSSATVSEFLGEWIAGERFRLEGTTWASDEIAVGRAKRHLERVKPQAPTPLDIDPSFARATEPAITMRYPTLIDGISPRCTGRYAPLREMRGPRRRR